jgi:hypothetical protein
VYGCKMIYVVIYCLNGAGRSHEVIRRRRDRSRMYFARRLRKRRMTILSLSEKVNHILSSVFFHPI